MNKNTPLQKRTLKPTKYQHFHVPGRSRGPPQTTKITPGGLLDPPQTPSENLMCFRSLPGPPRGAPGASLGPPRHPQGPPRDAQRPPGALPTTSQGPPREPNRARGPPQRPPGTPLGLFKIYALALQGDRLHVHVTCHPAALAGTRHFIKLPYAQTPPRDRPLDSARRNARSD